MKKKLLLRLILFCIIPFIISELLLRLFPFPNSYYLSKTDPFYKFTIDTSFHYNIFIGSSHVAAAINADIFNDILKDEGIITLNAGRGSSTSLVFYMAFQKLAREGNLRNMTVFLEAPGGGPASFTDPKTAEWVKSQNVHLLVPYLDFKSLCEFWKLSDNDLSTKIDLTSKYFFYTSRVFSLVKETYQGYTFKELLQKIAAKTGWKVASFAAETNKTDLVSQGGIKVDPVDIQNARELAYTYFSAQAKDQKIISFSDLQRSILNDMIALLKKNGCNLVLFNIPLSSVEKQIHLTEEAKINFCNLLEYIRRENVNYMDFKLSDYTDQDFPDLWHLSWEKSIEFSRLFSGKLKESNYQSVTD